MNFKVQRLDDRSIHAIFSAAQKAGKAAIGEIPPEGPNRNPTIETSFHTGLPWLPDDGDLSRAAGQFALQSASLYLRVEAPQSHQGAHASINFTLTRGAEDSIADTFSIQKSNLSNSFTDPSEKEILKRVHLCLAQALRPATPEDGGLLATLSNLAQGFDVSYRRISEELSNAVAAVNKERAQQILEFQGERAKLYEELTRERETQVAALAQEKTAHEAELTKQRAELAAQWAKLEVSSHKDARRKQFLEMQADLKDALATPVAPGSLRLMRYTVFFAIFGGGIAATALALVSIQAGVNAPAGKELITAVRSVILTFAALASFVGAAAWLRHFYLRDMEVHNEMRRFRNDMARASWVMDAALEIRKEHGEDIPAEWITGVTEGLFSGTRKEPLEEGAQALAALLGVTASASFGPGGTTVELGRKGGKEIAAAMRKQAEE